MSGTPGNLVCSECGHKAKRERKLFKTRRRWRWACLAMFLLLVGIGSIVAPRVHTRGWTSLVPTTALILAMPNLSKWSPPLAGELHSRFMQGDLDDWQLRLLFDRCVNTASPPWTMEILTRAAWPEDVEARFLGRVFRRSYSPWLDAMTLRWEITPRFDGSTRSEVTSRIDGSGSFATTWRDPETGATLNATNWRPRLARIGRLPTGTTNVTFDVQLSCQYPVSTRTNRWVSLWSGEVQRTLTVGGEISDHMTPAASPEADQLIREKLWVMGMNSTLRVIRCFGELPGLGDYSAVGLKIELLRDGQVLAGTSGWWGNNNAPRLSEILQWDWRTETIDPAHSQSTDAWSLRMRGDPHLALLAFDDKPANAPDARMCWSGEVVIPLRVGDPSGYLIPTWDYVAPRLWDWKWNAASTQRE